MELFFGLIIIIAAYILFGYLSYMIWELLFDTVSKTVTKCMKIVSIILGILWPISLPILLVTTIYSLFNDLAK